MAFNHHSDDPIIAPGNLACDVFPHVDLTLIVLLAVGMTQIDHYPLCESGGR